MNELKKTIDQYRPIQESKKLIQNSPILLLAGITGAGKDTIKKELLKSNEYQDIVSHTTRSPRINEGAMEIDGHDYHFISLDEARIMLNNQEFIEAKFVHGNIYGTSVKELQKIQTDQKIAVTDIDIQGAEEYKKMTDKAILIFLLPPSYQIWQERLSKRYTSTDEFLANFPKRKQTAVAELQFLQRSSNYHLVVNSNIASTVKIINQIIANPPAQKYLDPRANQIIQQLLNSL